MWVSQPSNEYLLLAMICVHKNAKKSNELAAETIVAKKVFSSVRFTSALVPQRQPVVAHGRAAIVLDQPHL